MEAIINLELFAKSQIDVFVEVLQVDGSDFCVAVNAATLALIDAGIPIKVSSRFCLKIHLPTPMPFYVQLRILLFFRTTQSAVP